MPSEEFISIVIPTLNEERYLETTLRAIRNQNFDGSYEIIVSDGGSKDKTIEIANKYRTKIVKSKRKGIGVGRNEGAKKAKGEIIVFIDGDTLLIPNTLSEIAKAFKDDKQLIGVAVPLLPMSSNAVEVIIFLSVNAFVKLNIGRGKGNARVVGACCAYKKSYFDQVGGFNEKIGALEDFDLSEKISLLGKIKYLEGTIALVSTRRIAKWGKVKSIQKYISLYLKHLLTEKGFEKFSIKKESYEPIR